MSRAGQSGGLPAFLPAVLGAGQASPEATFPFWQLGFISLILFFFFPFQLQLFERGRRCLGDWKCKILKVGCELWVYFTYLVASVHITACQHLMDVIHSGHLLSSLKVRTLQVTMLTALIFYRNAHSSVAVHGAWVLFLCRLLPFQSQNRKKFCSATC